VYPPCVKTVDVLVQVDEQYLLLGTYNGELKFYNVQTAEEYMSSTCHMSMMTNCQPSRVSLVLGVFDSRNLN